MIRLENNKSETAEFVAIVGLPDSILERRKLVDFAEWVATHYPWRLQLHARVKQRLDRAA